MTYHIRSYLLLSLFLFVFMTGCGKNLFLSDEKDISRRPHDSFSKLIEQSDNVINDPMASEEDISRATLEKSEAQLGNAGIKLSDFFFDFLAIADSASAKTIYDFVTLPEKISTDSFSEGVETLNSVNPNYLREDDRNAFLLQKGLINTMIAVKICQDTFDLEEKKIHGQNVSEREVLNSLFNTQASSIKPLDYYVLNATDALKQSLDDQDLEGITKLEGITNNLKALNNAAQADASVTIKGNTYDFSGSNDDRVITEALKNLL